MATIPVMFRKTLDGKVLAVMPSLPGPKDSIDSVSQGYNDQGKCFVDTSLLKHTQEASYGEYVSLLQGMANAGYTDIRIIQRIKSAYVDARKKAKHGHKYEAPMERPLIMQAQVA